MQRVMVAAQEAKQVPYIVRQIFHPLQILSIEGLVLDYLADLLISELQGARASDPNINPNRLLPAGFGSLLFKDWVLSPGLAIQSQANKKVNYALTLSKAPQFIRHSQKHDCWLTGKAHLLVDPKTAEVRVVISC